MSVVASIAYGIVNCDELTRKQRKEIHNAARQEAHAAGYWISGCRSFDCCTPTPLHPSTPLYTLSRTAVAAHSQHKLTRWSKNTFREFRRHARSRRPGITDRNRPLCEGTFTECCRALMTHIAPSNHETTDAPHATPDK